MIVGAVHVAVEVVDSIVELNRLESDETVVGGRNHLSRTIAPTEPTGEEM